MKITEATLSPDALAELRKVVQVRRTRWGTVVQTIGRMGKGKRSLLQRQYNKRFGLAASMASSPTPLEYETAREMAKGTEQVPRDILTMAALGHYYQIVEPDGTIWGHVPGPVYVPDPAPPTPPTPPSSPEIFDAMLWSLWDLAWSSHVSTAAYAFNGQSFTPDIDVSVTEIAAIFTATTAGTYQAACGTFGAGNVIDSLTLSLTVSGLSAGRQLVRFPLAHTFAAGSASFVMIGITSGSDTTPLPISYNNPAKWLWPCRDHQTCALAKKAPAIGQVLYRPGTNFAVPVGLGLA